jgi:hypothetical protein
MNSEERCTVISRNRMLWPQRVLRSIQKILQIQSLRLTGNIPLEPPRYHDTHQGKVSASIYYNFLGASMSGSGCSSLISCDGWLSFGLLRVRVVCLSDPNVSLFWAVRSMVRTSIGGTGPGRGGAACPRIPGITA